MKRKGFFLAPFILGLGAGLFLAGLLLLAYHRPPDRAAVIARAREYGMVFPQEVVPLAPAPDTPAAAGGEAVPEDVKAAGNGADAGAVATAPGRPTGAAGPGSPAATAVTSGGGSREEILVTIPAGAGLEEIAALLEERGVAAAAAFAAEVRRQGVELKLKAGSYYLPAGDIMEIIRRITS